MKDKNKIVIGVVLVVILIIAIYIFNKPYQWGETYKLEEKDPYNISLLRSVLEKSDDGRGFFEIEASDTVINFLNPDSIRPNSNLISFGLKHYTDSSDIDQLMKLTEQGHRVYFFSEKFDPDFLSQIIKSGSSDLANTDILDFDFYASSGFIDKNSDTLCTYSLTSVFNNPVGPILTKKRFKEKIVKKRWAFFNSGISEKEGFPLEKLGFQNGTDLNFIRIKNGEGYFYIHTSPFAFTNYNFIRADFYEYINEVLSTLGEGDIYWDQYLINYHTNPTKSNGSNLPIEKKVL